jgi:hypothetical protein
VPITTKVVSLNPAHVEVYSIQHYVIKFDDSDQQQVARKKLCIKIRIKYRDPTLEKYSLRCSSIYTLQIIQRTVLGLAPPKAGHGCPTKVVSLNPAHVEVYSIQHYVIKFDDSDQQQVGGFPQVLRFPPQIKLTATI